jgi:hypothetical protein
VFVFTYTLGKEEILITLAEKFETLVVVDEDRYRKIKIMDLRPELFTTDRNAGWIHVRPMADLNKMNLHKFNQAEPTIFIVLTGWTNKYNKKIPYYFKAPYSSHSNAKEIENFVKAMCPRQLTFNVRTTSK